MKCIKIASAAAFIVGVFAVNSASADTGLITFTGSVIDQTCVVSGGTGSNGGAINFTVPIDPANTSQLAAAGNVAGLKNFNVIFSDGAGGPCAATLTTAHFGFVASSPNVNTNGRLNNIIAAAGGGAANVELQLLDGVTPINLSAGLVKDITLSTTGPTTVPYGVQYFATGAATNGGVRSDIIYNATYN